MEHQLYRETPPPPKEFDWESANTSDDGKAVTIDEYWESANTSDDGKAVTIDEYWDSYYEHEVNYEWNRGKLEEVPVADKESSLLYAWFIDLVKEYLKTHPGFDCTFLEIGFRLEKPDEVDSVRKPDFGVIVPDNPTPWGMHEASYSGIIDLCIESMSFGSKAEIERDSVTKKEEYERIGVREYIILDSRQKPRTKRKPQNWKNETEFYRLNPFGVYEPIPREEGNVIRLDVLPGFAFRMKDLESLPKLEDLMDDPIYSPYVLLSLQKERAEKLRESQRADEEKLKAEQERQKAEQERQRAEKAEQQNEQAQQEILALRAELERRKAKD